MAKGHDKVIHLANSLLDAQKQLFDLLLDFMPDEAKKHLRTARKEKLLALRALLDNKIKNLEQKERSKKRPEKVKVE